MTGCVTPSLTEIRRWVSAELGQHIDRLAWGSGQNRLDAIAAIAGCHHRWLGPVLAALLPDRSLLVTEHLLYALYDFEPRLAIDAALRLAASGNPDHQALADLFLQGVPFPYPPVAEATSGNEAAPRAPAGAEGQPQPAADEAENPATRAQAAMLVALAAEPDAIDELLRRLEDSSPGVLRSCLAAIAQLDPDAAITQAAAIVRVSGNAFRLEVAAEFLIREDRARIDWLQQVASNLPAPWKMALSRALVRWYPDQALDLFRAWCHDPGNAAIVAHVLYEVAAAERGWPSPDSAVRLERCCDLGMALLENSVPQVRASALLSLAEAGWEDWPDWAELLLGDHSEVVRLEALDLLDRKGHIEDREGLRRLLVDADQRVRHRAFAALCRIATEPSLVGEEIERLCQSEEPAVRQQAAALLGEWQHPSGHRLLMLLQRDRDVHVRQAALAAGFDAARDPAEWRALVRRKLGSRFVEIRAKALELLGRHGDASDVRRIVARFKDQHADVRRAALEAATTLAPDQGARLSTRLLGDPQRSVAEAALTILTRCCTQEQRLEIVWQRLPFAEEGSAGLLIEHLQLHAPDEQDRLIATAAQSQSEAAQVFAVDQIVSRATPENLAVLKALLAQGDLGARLKALENVDVFPASEEQRLLIARLADRDWQVRLAAVQRLSDYANPQLVHALLPMARDPDGDVRRTSILSLARFDDVRVFSELVSSLADVNSTVREMAHEILDGQRCEVPSAERIFSPPGIPAWKWVRAQADAVNSWARLIGQELLGRPVEVLNYRQGLGRTRPPADEDRPIEIEVNDYPVTSGHRHGEDIMKGLALHEIGHHICDIGIPGDLTLRGIARSEGLGDIYDILADERLERVLRSRRRGWGVYFDRLASYAFAQQTHLVPLADYARILNRPLDETRAAVGSGGLPGRIRSATALHPLEAVDLSDADMLVVPGLLPVMAAFIACLRCGFDPQMHPDPRIAQAIDLVPANLKDLKHKHMLEIARKIGRVLGGAAEFLRDLRRMRRRLRRSGAAGQAWDDVLDRMAEAGQLPQWARQGAVGIRKNPPTTPPRAPPLPGGGSGRGVNSGTGQAFKPLEKEDSIPFDPAAHARLIGPLRKHIRRLRAYLERLGLQTVEEFASRRGRRLDLARARSAALRRDPGLLVHSHDEVRPNAYLGLLIDRSGSMQGLKLDLAKSFGGLVAEATRGLKGIEGHVNAFDDSTFIHLGPLQRTSVASLESNGANNDAGGLAKAAELAVKSGKRNKMLIMISDGAPTECTFESLRDLVTRLGREQQILCAQVAVDRIEQIAFPDYVNLSALPFEEAITRFGTLLMRLTRRWR